MKTVNEDIRRISQLMGMFKKQVISEQSIFAKFGLPSDLVQRLERHFNRHLNDLANAAEKKYTDTELATIRNMVSDTGFRGGMSNATSLREIAQNWLRYNESNLTGRSLTDEISELTRLLTRFDSESEAIKKNFIDDVLSSETLGNTNTNRFVAAYNAARTNIINRLSSATTGDFENFDDLKNLLRDNLSQVQFIEEFPGMLDALVKRLETDVTLRTAVRNAVNRNYRIFNRIPDFIDVPPIAQNINQATGQLPRLIGSAPTLVTINQGFSRFFIGYKKRMQALGSLFTTPNIERGIANFDGLLKASFDEALRLRGSREQLLNIYKTKLTQAFLELGRITEEGVNYKALWDELRSNVNASYTGDDLITINKFLDELETYTGKQDYYVSIKQAIDELSGGKSGDYFEEVADELASAKVKFFRKNLDDAVKKEVPNFWKSLLSYYGSGSFGTPKEMLRYFTKKGYRNRSILKGMVVRFIVINVGLPLILMLGEMTLDSIGKTIIQNSDNETIKSWAATLVGEEISGETNYIRDWFLKGITSELTNDSWWAQITRFIPGYIDDTILILTQFNADKIDDDVTKDLKPKDEEVLDKASEKGKDSETIDKVTNFSDPTLIKFPLLGDADTTYNDLRVKIKKLNNGQVIDGIDAIKNSFRFKDINEDGTYYFFFKDDPDKKLTLKRNISYADDGVHKTGTNFIAYDENNKKYEPNQIIDFTKHLIELVNNNKILTIQEYERMLLSSPKEFRDEIKKKFKQVTSENLKHSIKNLIKEVSEGKKFGDDNFKHWKDTFKFKKLDEKTGQLKDVKITSKMDEIMDRIDHFRKKYDEDDSFVRAVIDVFGTGIDVIQYTKGLAHLTEGIIPEGLLSVLSNLRESKELVTWTVKHYKDGNWELVKGNFNKQELLNVGKTKRERDERQKESENPAEGLKKKEEESMMILKRDEKEGLNGLPTKVKDKVKEKLRQGWTTETPFDFLSEFYTESEINSVFNEKIKIYKLKPSLEFFRSLAKNSAKINLKKGFCKSLKNAEIEHDISQREKNVLHNFISKCESKFGV